MYDLHTIHQNYDWNIFVKLYVSTTVRLQSVFLHNEARKKWLLGKKRGETRLKIKGKTSLEKSIYVSKSFVSNEHKNNLIFENWHCNTDFWFRKE